MARRSRSTHPPIDETPKARTDLPFCGLCLNDPETPCSKCRTALDAEQATAAADAKLAQKCERCGEAVDSHDADDHYHTATRRVGRIFEAYDPQPIHDPYTRGEGGRFA